MVFRLNDGKPTTAALFAAPVSPRSRERRVPPECRCSGLRRLLALTRVLSQNATANDSTTWPRRSCSIKAKDTYGNPQCHSRKFLPLGPRVSLHASRAVHGLHDKFRNLAEGVRSDCRLPAAWRYAARCCAHRLRKRGVKATCFWWGSALWRVMTDSSEARLSGGGFVKSRKNTHFLWSRHTRYRLNTGPALHVHTTYRYVHTCYPSPF